jgi:hypothetical protein
VLLIWRNPGGTCRDIYEREQLYPPYFKILLPHFTGGTKDNSVEYKSRDFRGKI